MTILPEKIMACEITERSMEQSFQLIHRVILRNVKRHLFWLFEYLKYIYVFYHLYYPYYSESSFSVTATHYVIKGRGNNIPILKTCLEVTNNIIF